MQAHTSTSITSKIADKLYKNQKELETTKQGDIAIFRSRIFKKAIDIILYAHINKIKIQDLIKKIDDPILLFDLGIVLEEIIDSRNSNIEKLRTPFYWTINNILKYEYFNENEEVLF